MGYDQTLIIFHILNVLFTKNAHEEKLGLKYYFGPNSNASEVVWKLETQERKYSQYNCSPLIYHLFSPLDLIYSSFSL